MRSVDLALKPKYSAEFILRFRSIDRFVYRAADLHQLRELTSEETLNRLDECTIYLVCARPRISVDPQSVRTIETTVAMDLVWRSKEGEHKRLVNLPLGVGGPRCHRVLLGRQRGRFRIPNLLLDARLT
jgi:hypothetical protein